MAAPDTVEMKVMLGHTQELITVLSSKPLSVAETLVDTGFFRHEILDKILVNKTAEGRSCMLVGAVIQEIELAPKKFENFVEVLSEQTWTKDIAERLSSTKQCKLDCMCTNILLFGIQWLLVKFCGESHTT